MGGAISCTVPWQLPCRPPLFHTSVVGRCPVKWRIDRTFERCVAVETRRLIGFGSVRKVTFNGGLRLSDAELVYGLFVDACLANGGSAR